MQLMAFWLFLSLSYVLHKNLNGMRISAFSIAAIPLHLYDIVSNSFSTYMYC